MKPAGFLLLIPAGLVNLADASEVPAGLVSRELKAHIREGLPAWRPPAPTGGPVIASEDPAPATPDPTILVLPKLTVKEKRLPADADRYLVNPKAYDRKMRNLYLDDLAKDGPLEAVLNRFTIPLFSPSTVAKGRALEKGRELDRLADLMSKEEAQSLNGMYDELALTLGRRAPKRR